MMLRQKKSDGKGTITNYDNLTSDADKRQNNWEFFKSISSSFIEAFIVGAVVALAVVMLPGSVVAGGIVFLAVGCIAMTAVPEEKVPSWLQGSRDIGNQLITDPLSIINDMGQGFMDKIQTPEGIASVTGEFAGGLVGGAYGTKLKPKVYDKVHNIQSKPTVVDDVSKKASGSGKTSKEVEIINKNGSPLGEFDEIDLNKGIFYEDKTAKGLDVVNPRTGLPTQTPQQFADKQIYQKTVNRIKNLDIADATRPTVNGSQSIPSLQEIKGIKKFVFRLDGNSAELQSAVNQSIKKLQSEFPDYTFEVIFGGK